MFGPLIENVGMPLAREARKQSASAEASNARSRDGQNEVDDDSDNSVDTMQATSYDRHDAARRVHTDPLESTANAASARREAAPPPPAHTPRPLHLDAVLVSLREDALRELRAGYPSAQAAEQLLLRLAAADAACVMHLQTAELALANKVHESLVHDAGNVLALARALKDIVTVNTAIRGRVQSSLTAASTLMAQRRLAQVHRPGVDE
jgi:hypothetical protein